MITRRRVSAGLVSWCARGSTRHRGSGANSDGFAGTASRWWQASHSALRLRRSIREYPDRPLPTQVLLDLL